MLLLDFIAAVTSAAASAAAAAVAPSTARCELKQAQELLSGRGECTLNYSNDT